MNARLSMLVGLHLSACGSLAKRVPEECGDGIWAPFEACDPADEEYGAWCKDDCTWHVCGDGVVAGVEACDPPGPECTSTCQPVSCGDGVIGAEESCWRLVTLTPEAGVHFVTVGDADLDGDVDVLTLERGRTDVAVWLNEPVGFGRVARVELGLQADGILVRPDAGLVAWGEGSAVAAVFEGGGHTRIDGVGVDALTDLLEAPAAARTLNEHTIVLLPSPSGVVWLDWRTDATYPSVSRPPAYFDEVSTFGYPRRFPNDVLGGELVAPDGSGSIGVTTSFSPAPGPPRWIRASPWALEDQLMLEWMGEDGVLYWISDVLGEPSAEVALTDPRDALWFKRTADSSAPLGVVWTDATGLHVREGDTTQAVLPHPALGGIDFADLDGDGDLDLVTWDTATGDLLLLMGDW